MDETDDFDLPTNAAADASAGDIGDAAPDVEPVSEPNPNPEGAPVRLVVPESEYELPSFAEWLAGMGFPHATLSAKQLDSMLGAYLVANLN